MVITSVRILLLLSRCTPGSAACMYIDLIIESVIVIVIATGFFLDSHSLPHSDIPMRLNNGQSDGLILTV